MIRQDPYQLANDIPGIGFPIADKIAINLGIEKNPYDRAQSCILHILREATRDGHVYVNEKDLLERISDPYEIDSQTAGESIEDLTNSGDIVAEYLSDTADGRAIYLKSMWQAEHVKGRLEELHPGLEVELLGMSTKGDKIQDKQFEVKIIPPPEG